MSVSVLRPNPGVSSITIHISAPPAPPTDPAVEGRWAELLRDNPRLFDGPILSVERMDLAAGTLSCRREGYKRLAVQPEVPTGVQLLSVTGILTARSRPGIDHVLIGKRGRQTRVYGGMWELAPSGGIEPPSPDATRLDWSGILDQLASELAGETGLTTPIEAPFLLGAIRDPEAFSLDLAVRASFSRPVEYLRPARANWEYAETRWLPLTEIPAFAAREPFVETSLAVLDLLGWR